MLNAHTLDIILEDRKAKKIITCIKYSPDAQLIAMGSKEGKVFIHSAENYSLLRTLQPAARRLDNCLFDFSSNGEVIRVACSTDDLTYFGAHDGTQITLSTSTRDLLWNSSSCPLTWLSQGAPASFFFVYCTLYRYIVCSGIRRPPSDNVQIIATATNYDLSMIAVSYQDGSVRLFRYPCVAQWVRLSHAVNSLDIFVTYSLFCAGKLCCHRRCCYAVRKFGIFC